MRWQGKFGPHPLSGRVGFDPPRAAESLDDEQPATMRLARRRVLYLGLAITIVVNADSNMAAVHVDHQDGVFASRVDCVGCQLAGHQDRGADAVLRVRRAIRCLSERLCAEPARSGNGSRVKRQRHLTSPAHAGRP